MRRLGTNWAGIKPRRVTFDGITFASAGESRRYSVLKLEQHAKQIRNLQVHVKLPLVVNGKKIGRGYIEIDFHYDRLTDGKWIETWEDYKGVMTREAQQRIKLAEALHGITINISGGRAA